MYKLDERLANDTVSLGNFALSEVLLMKDAQFPWVILVPRRDGVSELFDLPEDEQQVLWQESVFVAKSMKAALKARKMNVAALGNVVPQLHVHHVARFETDVAWPKPVWGQLPPKPYSESELAEKVIMYRKVLEGMWV